MPLIYHEMVKKYAIDVNSASGRTRVLAEIWLYLPNFAWGVLNFYADDDELQDSDSWQSVINGKQYYVFAFRLSQYPHALDLLRRRRPVWLRIWDEPWFRGSLESEPQVVDPIV